MIKKSLTKKYKINGPTNIFRLTNGKKIIYIIGDVHNDINEQTQCTYNNIESIDIDKLLIKIFKKEKDKKFDIFYEFYYKKNINLSNYKKDPYILELYKLNNIEFINNKIQISKYFPNVRFHYFDIRETISYINELYIIYKYFKYDLRNYPYSSNILYYINDIMKKIVKLVTDFSDNLKLKNNIYINKLLSKYNNIDIQNSILNIYSVYFIELFDVIINIANDTINYISNNNNLFNITTLENNFQSQKPIFMNINKIIHYIDLLCIILTDLFLLRRLLDKDYTNNNIIYTGYNHFIDITYFLVKYFNFKITHITDIQNIQNINIDNIENEFNIDYKNFDSLNNLRDIIDNSLQCVDIFHFPDNFS